MPLNKPAAAPATEQKEGSTTGSVKNVQAAATKWKEKNTSKGSSGSVVKNATPAAAPNRGKASKGSQQMIKPTKQASSRDSRTSSADEQASLPAAKESSTAKDGDESEYYFGMYRKILPSGAGRLKPLYKAFSRFHPWRPKKNWDDSCLQFLTTGYYPDMDGGAGSGDLKPNQVRINNLPPGTTEAELRKEFPSATKFQINGSAIMDFNDPAKAEKAYNDSTLVRMGNRNLAWLQPDEVYLVGVPDGKTIEDLETDYPGNKGIKFIENTGTSRVAVIKFANAKAAADGFEEAPFKKIGEHQHGYDIEEATLHINNLPPSVTEADLQEKFPGAKDIHFNSTTGHAKLMFDDDKQSRKAYNEADMPKLGRPKLLWLSPEEMTLENVPDKFKENDLKKDFPTAKKIRFMKGEGGKRIAVMEFPSQADQKKAFESSGHKKVGPSRLGWSDEAGTKPDENAILHISDLPPGVTAADLKEKFPGAKDIQIDSKTGHAKLIFNDAKHATKAYNEADVPKLGRPKLLWLKPEEMTLENLPDKIQENDLKKDFPTAKKIRFVKGEGGKRIAVMEFSSPADQKKAFESSGHKKVGPSRLGWSDEAGKPDENAILHISDLPPGVTAADLKEKFPGAKDIQIDSKSGNAKLIFNDAKQATKAYNEADVPKLGKPKLLWLKPEEMTLENLPDKIKEDDLKKDFPTAKKIRFMKGEGGKRIAVMEFSSPADQKKAFESSGHKKVGPSRLGWSNEAGKPDENAILHISDLPPGVTAADLKEKFPGAKDIQIDSKTGHAKLIFNDDKQAQNAYNEADIPKLGRPKLLWLKPEEMTLENLPDKIQENDLKKDFPTAKKIRFMKGEGGKRIAVMEFPSQADQKKAFESSGHKKVGPSRLGWSDEAGARRKSDDNAQLKISNIPKGITEAGLKKKFPGATEVKLHGGNAVIKFGSRADADKGYKESDMAKLGDNKLVFLKPAQIAFHDMPTKNEKAIKKDMPDAKKIHWLNGPDKTKVAIVEFDDAEKSKSNYDNSVHKKIGPQKLAFDPDATPLEELNDEQLANQLWKLKEKDYSNISNLFSMSIKLIGVPKTTKGVDLVRMFEDCKKCEFELAGTKRTAIVHFDNPTSAARAFTKARNTKIDGKEIKVEVVPLGGGKTTTSTKDSGEEAAKKSASTTAGIKKAPAIPSSTSLKK